MNATSSWRPTFLLSNTNMYLCIWPHGGKHYFTFGNFKACTNDPKIHICTVWATQQILEDIININTNNTTTTSTGKTTGKTRASIFYFTHSNCWYSVKLNKKYYKPKRSWNKVITKSIKNLCRCMCTTCC